MFFFFFFFFFFFGGGGGVCSMGTVWVRVLVAWALIHLVRVFSDDLVAFLYFDICH